MTRTRLLGQQERWGAREVEREREAGPPRREEGWTPEQERQQALEVMRRGDKENQRSSLVRAVCIAGSNAGGDLDVQSQVYTWADLSSGPGSVSGLGSGLGLWCLRVRQPPITWTTAGLANLD